MASWSAVLLIALGCAVAVAVPTQPLDPIVGVFSQPISEFATYKPPPGGPYTQIVEALYPQWLAAAGIRTVPLKWNDTKANRDAAMKQVNGVLFMGGDLGGEPLRAYFDLVRDVVETAQKWTAEGDPFVVWGTCMGFQLVCAAFANNLSVIETGFVGMDPAMLPITFTEEAAKSQLFGGAPAYLNEIFTTQNSTLNWHQCGVTPAAFKANGALRSGLRLLATSNDTNGRTFAAAVESPVAPIFATQFHPERVQFEYTSDSIGHTVGDIEVAEFLSLFVKGQLQRNNHSFPSPDDAEAASIHNYPQAYYGLGYQLYFLK